MSEATIVIKTARSCSKNMQRSSSFYLQIEGSSMLHMTLNKISIEHITLEHIGFVHHGFGVDLPDYLL